jgi:hypothetical protein
VFPSELDAEEVRKALVHVGAAATTTPTVGLRSLTAHSADGVHVVAFDGSILSWHAGPNASATTFATGR